MFSIGDYIIYGANGVCKITDITDMPVKGSKSMRKYYVLDPVYMKESTIFTPIDNDKVVMRRILNKQEIQTLIEGIEDIPVIDIREEKNRTQYYHELIRTYDCTNLVRVVKTVYMKKKERATSGKKILSTDDTFLKKAEDLLYGEMALALSIPKESVSQYIEKKIKGEEASSLCNP